MQLRILMQVMSTSSGDSASGVDSCYVLQEFYFNSIILKRASRFIAPVSY